LENIFFVFQFQMFRGSCRESQQEKGSFNLYAGEVKRGGKKARRRPVVRVRRGVVVETGKK
jgi:hypothetical protein